MSNNKVYCNAAQEWTTQCSLVLAGTQSYQQLWIIIVSVTDHLKAHWQIYEVMCERIKSLLRMSKPTIVIQFYFLILLHSFLLTRVLYFSYSERIKVFSGFTLQQFTLLCNHIEQVYRTHGFCSELWIVVSFTFTFLNTFAFHLKNSAFWLLFFTACLHHTICMRHTQKNVRCSVYHLMDGPFSNMLCSPNSQVCQLGES